MWVFIDLFLLTWFNTCVALLGEREFLLLMGLGIPVVPPTGLLEVLVPLRVLGVATGSLLVDLLLALGGTLCARSGEGEGSLEACLEVSSRKPLPRKGLTLPFGELLLLLPGGGVSSLSMTKAVFSLLATGGATRWGGGALGGAGSSGLNGGRTLNASGIMMRCRLMLGEVHGRRHYLVPASFILLSGPWGRK